MNAATGPRVAVAAAGAVTCLGGSVEATWEGLLAGRSGLGPVGLFPVEGIRSAIGGVVDGLPGLRGGERLARLAVQALRPALARAEQQGLTRDQLRDAWIVLGVSLGDIFEQGGPDVELDHFWEDVALELGLTGPVVPLSSACSSGTDAVAYGAELIVTGIADVVLAVGLDSLEPNKFSGHAGLKTMSPDRCRPYDAESDGTTLAEAACCLVLAGEGLVAGAGRPLGWVRGWAASTDVDSLTSPDMSGRNASRMIGEALAMAGGSVGQVGYLNGHGSGTPVNDEMEAAVYRAAFPAGDVPVSATKGALGHTLGATGTVEALATLLALRDRTVPPTAGLRGTHPRWDGIPVVIDRQLALDERPLGVSVTYGFGGANSCLVLSGGAR
ncbi:3-oxoacyl-[acyl-carrier-protein] synthase II [Streptomyces sp. 846.5]|nr:beta-ketoacyl synthase N-terminal-like domain-containing protein [Streptomyces sp. 846.5]TDU02219.1 3-oxoacyl-[acyl-carrier-protein] synthase II [Streptomyces sp. 846.5]